MTEAAEPQPPLSHAERAELLNFLFDKARPKGGRKIPNKVVAAHVAERTGQNCSEEWISGLRKADPGRPMIVKTEQLDAIADFFHVNPVIWVDREQASIIMASMNVVDAARGSGVRAVALRSFAEAFTKNHANMTVENLNALAALMDSFGATNPTPTRTATQPTTPDVQQWPQLTRDQLEPTLRDAVLHHYQDDDFWARVRAAMADNQVLAGHLRGLLSQFTAAATGRLDEEFWLPRIVAVRSLLTDESDQQERRAG